MPDNEFRITVKTFKDFEPLLESEIVQLGGKNVEQGNRVVHFMGNDEHVYRMNFCLRTALRVLIPIENFIVHSSDDMYRKVKRVDWSRFLDVNSTFAIEPNSYSLLFRHPHFASHRMKDAIADYFTSKHGKRPDINTTNPDVQFDLHIDANNRVTISLDSSGRSLNQRGYRKSGADAPLNEVLAAGMIMLAGWKGESDFYNPMCGSGTLAIEAAMIARNLPPQSTKPEFGFMRWKNFDEELWREVKRDSFAKTVIPSCIFFASDIDPRQLNVARTNVSTSGMGEFIRLAQKDFMDELPTSENGIIIMNPPYGERLDAVNIPELYKKIGDRLKHNWPGFQVWFISSNMEALKNFGLKPSKKIRLLNGSLECLYQKFELFRGKKNAGVV
ncbi:MAG: THUMP domain-containing protein [Flavobacteriales bacterium]|nr:THUMP domain-containing protein [Flavobacteriales bacterium]